MSYCLVINGAIEAERGSLPRNADLNGSWVAVTPQNAEACGWFEVVDVTRPVSTSSDWTRSVTLVSGKPTVTWTVRPWTQAELDAQAAQANRQIISDRAQANIDALKLIKNSSGTLTGLQLSNAVRALAAAELDVMRYLYNQTSTLD